VCAIRFATIRYAVCKIYQASRVLSQPARSCVARYASRSAVAVNLGRSLRHRCGGRSVKCCSLLCPHVRFRYMSSRQRRSERVRKQSVERTLREPLRRMAIE